jgi:alpha-maltose-1-phosphate synthase
MPLPSPAILFLPAGYQTSQADLMGLRVANRSFLQGLIRHGGLNTLNGYVPQQGICTAAFEQLARDLGADVPVRMIEGHRLDQLAEIGGLVVPDPNLAAFARHRSFIGAQAYALTGVTHAPVISMMADMATAPVQSWDALVCTSRAVASAVEQVMGAEEARLAEQLGATRFSRPLLPVIPLGVDTADFTTRDEWRAAWRERLGIAAEDVVALYVGRLSRHGKAHPLPMLVALGRAARSLPRRLHLILAGWWLHPPEEAIWQEQAIAFCPEVKLHLLDGRDEAVRREIRSAADVFTLLVDNVQESFGLAPVEAMAAGLPVVATDWDGFRDTVRNGVDGILVPTLMAPPGEAGDIALRHATSNISYGAFLSLTARLTAVDIGAAADAYRALAADPALRRRMGEAGQARARALFDWSAVIPQYQALWREQQAIRLAAPATKVTKSDPRHMDPTQAFAAWPSAAFHITERLRAEPSATTADLSALLRFTAPSLPSELHEAEIDGLLAELRRRNEVPLNELLQVLEPTRHSAGRRAALWLLRTGLAIQVRIPTKSAGDSGLKSATVSD